MSSKNKKMKKENLKWLDPQNGAKYHAGVAFYDENYGEYRLVLDGPRTVFNLKPFESKDDEIRYKVYSPVLVRGRFSHKVEVGYGYSNKATKGDVYITIGRYGSMKLLLPKMEEETTNA